MDSQVELIVRYIDRGNGWYEILLISGNQTLAIPASEAFDPFEDMERWVQNIASGAVESRFSIDPEGELVYLEYRLSGASGRFTVKQPTLTDQGELFSVDIQPDELVKAFQEHYSNFECITDPEWEKEVDKMIQEMVDDGFLIEYYPPPESNT